jgi:hypothetical protein
MTAPAIRVLSKAIDVSLAKHNEPVWVVQSNLGSSADFERIRCACEELGLPFIPVAAIPFSEDLPDIPTEPLTIFYGSSNFVTNVHRSGRWRPAVFFDEKEFRYSVALHKFGNHLLNSDAEVTTMDAYSRRDLPADQLIFVRPDGDLKEFAGGTQTFGEFQAWCEKLRPGGFTLELSSSIVVANPKDIDHEWRLFVANGKVASGSHYREFGRLAPSPIVSAEVMAFGEEMARLWSPAPAFVLDIALVGETLKIVEVNGFNSSGFYASDVKAIIKAVSSIACPS